MARDRITERRLVDVLVSHFRRQFAIQREVKFYEKRIDIAAICHDTDELWAIEAKTEKWTHAVGQAIVNLAAADRSFVALYSGNIHRVSLDLLDRHGIGLISVGTRWGDVQIIKHPLISRFTNRLASHRIRADICGA